MNQKNNYILLTDSRQRKEEHIVKEFNIQNILHIRTGLPSGDYMVVRYDEIKGFYLDYSTIIDTKKDIVEICGNLCSTTQHERIKREIAKAHELGCKRFIFLIADAKITCIDELDGWRSSRTNVKGEVLAKVMKTMSERYGCEFIFCKKKEMATKIISFLTNES